MNSEKMYVWNYWGILILMICIMIVSGVIQYGYYGSKLGLVILILSLCTFGAFVAMICNLQDIIESQFTDDEVKE